MPSIQLSYLFIKIFCNFQICNITPVFRQGTRNLKDNYRPISILPTISKIFEKLICRHIFSKFQCRFRKGFNAQHYLLLITDKWKKAIDDNQAFGALFTDISKTFDCIYHNSLVTKPQFL